MKIYLYFWRLISLFLQRMLSIWICEVNECFQITVHSCCYGNVSLWNVVERRNKESEHIQHMYYDSPLTAICEQWEMKARWCEYNAGSIVRYSWEISRYINYRLEKQNGQQYGIWEQRAGKCAYGDHREGVKLGYHHGMHAATVWNRTKTNNTSSFTNRKKYNTTHSIHFTTDMLEKVVGDTSLRGQNCVIRRLIMTAGSVSCTNVGTISNLWIMRCV